jgi:hypothetical protein
MAAHQEDDCGTEQNRALYSLLGPIASMSIVEKPGKVIHLTGVSFEEIPAPPNHFRANRPLRGEWRDGLLEEECQKIAAKTGLKDWEDLYNQKMAERRAEDVKRSKEAMDDVFGLMRAAMCPIEPKIDNSDFSNPISWIDKISDEEIKQMNNHFKINPHLSTADLPSISRDSMFSGPPSYAETTAMPPIIFRDPPPPKMLPPGQLCLHTAGIEKDDDTDEDMPSLEKID